MWDLNERYQVYLLTQNNPTGCLAIRRNDEFMIFDCDYSVKLWNLDTKVEEIVFEGHTDTILSIVCIMKTNV